MADELTVVTISPAETEKTLTAAFIADPLFRWAFPDADNLLDGFPKLVAAYCG